MTCKFFKVEIESSDPVSERNSMTLKKTGISPATTWVRISDEDLISDATCCRTFPTTFFHKRYWHNLFNLNCKFQELYERGKTVFQ
jgi:hypothetical protein